MRRLLVLTSCALLVVCGPVPAAHSDVTVVVTADPVGDPPYFAGTAAFLDGFDCAVGERSEEVFRLVEGDGPVPPEGLGERSWGFAPVGGEPGWLHGVGVDVGSQAGLDTFGVQVHGPGGNAGRAVVLARPVGTAAGNVWVGIAPVSGGGGAWTTVDASGLAYTWGEYVTDGWQPAASLSEPATLDEFDAAHGSPAGYTALIGFGCDGQPFLYDGFRYGAAGDVTTLDFEALTTHLAIGAAPRTVIAGRTARLTGGVDARYPRSTPVDLEVKPYGARTFRKLATVRAPEPTYTLARTVTPLRRAAYRWHFLGTEIHDPAYSRTVVILVRTALSAVVADATLRRGQHLVVTGRTRPAKPGVMVTLRRRTGSGPVALARTRVRSDGSYRVVRRVGRGGRWTVFTTVEAASGNLAGRSVDRTASVS